MKKFNILSISLLLIMSILFGSCDSWIDQSINEDPNNPLDVPMDFLIPAIQANMAYDLNGNDAVRTTNIWMQYFDGVDRQSLAEAQYNYGPSNCNNLWNSNYGVTGKDIYILIEKANELNSAGQPKSVYTRGMAKVMMAELMAFNTNFWNDVPYSEAFMGDIDGNLSPIADSQEAIYGVIDQLLADAIADLSAATSGIDIPADMIFDGDEDMWLATAYALRARYSLILSKRNGAAAYTNALTYADAALTAGFTGYAFTSFGTSATEQCPLYQFMDQRGGDLVMCSTFINYLVTNSDPRLTAFSTGTVGSVPGSQTTSASLPGNFVAAKDADVYHMNLAELYFIQAEAYFQTGSPGLAYTAFTNGIAASLADVGVTSTVAFEGSYPASSAALTLADIMYQKYVANYGTVQAFNDYRRTGLPVTAVPATAVRSEMPRRFPYPTEEVTYNSNISNDGITILDRVWWDVQ